MAESTADLTYELLKRVHLVLDLIDHKIDEVKNEMQAMCGNLVSLQQDVHNIYSILTRHETRLERIERRLELAEIPAS